MTASDALPARPLGFTLDGERIDGREGDTVASALLRAGITTFTRSIKFHRPRGPFCFAGSCGQCLMRVDGVPSLPACRVPLREGMRCVRQNAPLGADADVLRASFGSYETALGTRPPAEPPRLFERNPLPTLLLYGPEDHVVLPSFPWKAAAACIDCTGPLFVPRAGHFLQWEAAETFNKITTAFCR